MSLKDKAQSFTERLDKITGTLSETLDLSEEMTESSDDLISKANTARSKISQNEISYALNLEQMVSDFQYIRDTLRENTDNGRRVLNAVTLELLSEDDDKRASLVMSFAELNKAVADNMKLYILSYKEISKVLLDIEDLKVKKGEVKNDEGSRPKVNTAEVIKRFTEKN